MHRRAILIFLLSASLFGVMAFTAKIATARIPGAQVAMVRFAIGLVPVLISPSIRRAAVRFQRLDLLFYRGFFGGIAVLLYFTAIEHIPVGLATLLNYTAPVFSGFFAAQFIGEPVRGRVLLPLVVAFSGIVLVVRAHATPGELFAFGPWEALGLASAVCSGAAVTAIRIARRSESSWSIFASFSLFGLLATAPVAVWQWRSPSARDWMLLIAIGLISIAAQLFMTHAFRWVDTLTGGVIAQFAVIVSMVLGAVWLGERMTPLSAIGSALTIGGIVA
ncbi:MAG TPA: DMT family transporter, partial [Thermoanaerobaculia bacterium]